MNIILSVHNIFYSSVSILIGILLFAFGIYQFFKGNRKLLGIISIIHSLLFIGFGVYGYIIPKKYEVIIVLALLAFTITMIITLLLLFKKDDKR